MLPSICTFDLLDTLIPTSQPSITLFINLVFSAEPSILIPVLPTDGFAFEIVPFELLTQNELGIRLVFTRHRVHTGGAAPSETDLSCSIISSHEGHWNS